MANIALRIIRPIESAAEKEYIKEFFRFVGCFVSDYVVDDQVAESWEKCLVPDDGENKVDIIINYYGKDPYKNVCQQLNINRIYCYVDFTKNTVRVTTQPDLESMTGSREIDRATVRKNLLTELIQKIWVNDAETCN